MDNKKRVGSSSSFTSDLFGAKDSSVEPSASTGVFSSIFPPPSTIVGRNCSTIEHVGSSQKQSPSQAWNKGTSEEMAKKRDGNNSYGERGSIFPERVDSSPLSSALYYGGQEDMYVRSSSTQPLGSYTKFKKSEGEDDPNSSNSHSASRGNWWQGSLYY